jgi:hypothetical protein
MIDEGRTAMKRNQTFSSFLLLFSLGVLPGCLEHEVTTTVNADGSCDRVVIVSSDASGIPSTRFPIMYDASWDTGRVTMRDSASKTGFRMSKHFVSGEDLAAAYAAASEPENIQVAVTVTKSFRWFYTYHHYRESYRMPTADTLIPPEQVMTEEQIRQFTEGEKSDTLKTKFEEWRMRNLFEALMQPIIDGAVRRQDSAMASLLRGRVKEEIFHQLLEADRRKSADSSKSKKKEESPEDSLLNAIVRATGKHSTTALKDDITRGFKVIEEQLKNGPSLSDAFKSSVIMPGVLLDTNAPTVQATHCSWKLDGEQMVMRPFVMSAASRTVNLWAFIVAGVVAAGLLGLLFRPVFLRK